MSSDNRVALVTGGAGGLGLASAKLFAEKGVKVAIADLDPEAAAAAAAALPGSGHLGIGLDVSSETQVHQRFEDVEAAIGPVAILANFAGVLRAGSGGLSLTEITLEEWDRVFAVNASGAFLVVREFARRRAEKLVEHGRVILVSSSGAQIGGYQGSPAYFASKGAVLTLIKAAARELAPLAITVNGIAPGPIDTPMLRAATAARSDTGDDKGYTGMSRVPLNRVGQPEEIAAAAWYLASPEAGYVTGSVIDVNGGLRMQ